MKTARPSVKAVKIYVEGDAILRPSFQLFFSAQRERIHREARLKFQIEMWEGNSSTHDKWRYMRDKEPENLHLLLIDSEGAVGGSDSEVPASCTSFLTEEDLRTGDVYFMTQLMESWYLTKVAVLERLYKRGFKADKLPKIPTAKAPTAAGEALEAVSKQKVEDGLAEATKETTKGPYDRTNAKTTIAPLMLEELKPEEIAKVSYHLRRLLERLSGITTE